MKWNYIYLTTTEQVKQFEIDRDLLNKKKFTQEVEDIIFKIAHPKEHTDLDIELMSCMTKESMSYEMSRSVSAGAQEYSLKYRSFNYLQSIIVDLFSFHNFLDEHKRYCFINHGYPIDLNLEEHIFSPYIIYKVKDEIYKTVCISELDMITKIMNTIAIDCVNVKERVQIKENTLIFLQHNG